MFELLKEEVESEDNMMADQFLVSRWKRVHAKSGYTGPINLYRDLLQVIKKILRAYSLGYCSLLLEE